MNQIKIVALTENGKKAIDIHLSECNTFKIKFALKKLGIRQEIVSNEPYVLRVDFLNKDILNVWSALKTMSATQEKITQKEKELLANIHDAMHKNGAIQDIDYSVEVE